jgi:hypothetical protein
VRTVLVWGASALLGLYSAGNIVELTGMVVVDPGRIDMRSLAYIVFFLAGAAGYGALAVSEPHALYSPLRRIALVTSEAAFLMPSTSPAGHLAFSPRQDTRPRADTLDS